MPKPNTRTYKVTFRPDALPGVRAVGPIKRGATVEVDAAEALRLVNAKGLAFDDTAEKARAEAEMTASAQPADAAVPPPPADAATAAEEH
ncbi:hypothetical protein [Dyella sp.]|uniref:hypothetical protein n=1 Tax=Dyella sp. TaxID=1869338 RepID=UPI003F7DB4EA